MNSLDVVVERGLAGKRVKVGDGEKTPGYALKAVTVRKVVLGVVCVGLILAGGLLANYRVALMERMNASLAIRKGNEAEMKNFKNSMKLMTALAEQESHSDEVIRMMKRVRGFTEKKTDQAKVLFEGDSRQKQLEGILKDIGEFIDSELKDYEKDVKEDTEMREKRMKKILERQEFAMKKLLTRITDERLDSLEDLLERFFGRLDTMVHCSLDESKWEPFEELIDSLYQQETTSEAAMKKFNQEFRPAFLHGISEAHEERIKSALKHGRPEVLADALDEIWEMVQLSKSKDKLVELRSSWEKVKKEFEAKKKPSLDEEFNYESATVNTVMEVQRLISQGHVSHHLFDFYDVDVGDDDDNQEDEDEDDDDDDAANDDEDK